MRFEQTHKWTNYDDYWDRKSFDCQQQRNVRHNLKYYRLSKACRQNREHVLLQNTCSSFKSWISGNFLRTVSATTIATSKNNFSFTLSTIIFCLVVTCLKRDMLPIKTGLPGSDAVSQSQQLLEPEFYPTNQLVGSKLDTGDLTLTLIGSACSKVPTFTARGTSEIPLTLNFHNTADSHPKPAIPLAPWVYISRRSLNNLETGFGFAAVTHKFGTTSGLSTDLKKLVLAMCKERKYIRVFHPLIFGLFGLFFLGSRYI